MDKQHTIHHGVTIEGKGIHSGEDVRMTVHPAPADTGLIFRRIDLPDQPELKVTPEAVQEALMCTTLVSGDIKLSTIEHFMSAASALQMDNLIIDVNAAELPVMDGSAEPFLLMLESCGVVSQPQPRRTLRVLEPVRVEKGDAFAEFHPHDDGLKLSIELDYSDKVIAHTPLTIEYTLDRTTYLKDVSRARTYGFFKDLEALHQNGLAKGAGLDNAVGVTDEGIMNEGGLRYPDEFVRHKLLDAIGDLYVAGAIHGHFKAYKCGHALNNMLLRKWLSMPEAYHWE